MKKRVIPCILLKGGTNVWLSQSFSPWRSVGALVQQLRLHINRSCDELLIIDLNKAGSKSLTLSNRILSLVRQEVDVPISYAGGISSALDASLCINAGFDKVYVTSAFLDKPNILESISDVIGMQSLGLSLPYTYVSSEYLIWDYRSSSAIHTPEYFSSILSNLSSYPVGEVLFHSVDRDGSLSGLDHEFFDFLSTYKLTLPTIVAGGSSCEKDFANALNYSFIQGVSASSIFALTQSTPSTIRSYCESKGISMRRA